MNAGKEQAALKRERKRQKLTSLILMLLAYQPSESDLSIPVYNPSATEIL